MSNKPIIKLHLDHYNKPALTEEQKARLEKLAAMPDSEIDYSDIPPQDFSGSNARKNLPLPVDFEVYGWLQAKSRYYKHFRINEILRQEMLADIAAEKAQKAAREEEEAPMEEVAQ